MNMEDWDMFIASAVSAAGFYLALESSEWFWLVCMAGISYILLKEVYDDRHRR